MSDLLLQLLGVLPEAGAPLSDFFKDCLAKKTASFKVMLKGLDPSFQLETSLKGQSNSKVSHRLAETFIGIKSQLSFSLCPSAFSSSLSQEFISRILPRGMQTSTATLENSVEIP